MKITLESTTKIVQLVIDGKTVPARIWQGSTERGVPCHAFITRICPSIPIPELKPGQADEFERDLKEHQPPRAGIEGIPLRLIL